MQREKTLTIVLAVIHAGEKIAQVLKSMGEMYPSNSYGMSFDFFWFFKKKNKNQNPQPPPLNVFQVLPSTNLAKDKTNWERIDTIWWYAHVKPHRNPLTFRSQSKVINDKFLQPLSQQLRTERDAFTVASKRERERERKKIFPFFTLFVATRQGYSSNY